MIWLIFYLVGVVATFVITVIICNKYAPFAGKTNFGRVLFGSLVWPFFWLFILLNKN